MLAALVAGPLSDKFVSWLGEGGLCDLILEGVILL